jgi:transcription elongation factor GreA
MATATRVWISPQAHERLHRELDTLRFLFSAGMADEDTDKNATAVRRAWEKRIQQIHDLLINAVVGEDPPDDGVAEPGHGGHHPPRRYRGHRDIPAGRTRRRIRRHARLFH